MTTRISLLVAGILVLVGAPTAAADAVPEYFTAPAGLSPSSGIGAAPDGTVWFGANPASPNPSIGRLTPSQASPGTANGIATFPTPKLSASCCANAVLGVAFDPQSNLLWFVQNDGIVGHADPTQVSQGTSNGIDARLVSTTLKGGGTFAPGLVDVAIGKSGLAWFTENGASNVDPYPGGRIASIDKGLTVTESKNIALQGGATLDKVRFDPKPAGITTDAAGIPWFAEADAGNPGYRIAQADGLGYDEYLITPCAPDPCSGSFSGTGPSDVAVAHDGSIWFTNQLKNEVGRLDTANHAFTNYSLPALDKGLAIGQARAISVASDGTLWVVENGGIGGPNANAVIRIVPSQPVPTASVWHLGAGLYPLGVAPDTKGNVWFTGSTNTTTGFVGRLAGVIGASEVDPGGGNPGGGQPGGDGPIGGAATGGAPSGGAPTSPGKALTPASVGVARVGSPSTDGPTVNVSQACVGPPADPCSLVFLISSHEYVAGFPGSKASAAAAAKKKGRKPKPVILGKKTLTLHGGQHKKVTIELNAAGKQLLKKRGKLTLFFTATQKGAPGKAAKRIKATKITFKR